MHAFDTLEIEILDDGTIKTITNKVSGANHSNAEQFLRHMAALAGGTVERVKRADVQGHTHAQHTQDQHAHE
jgi:hypothetical protein